MKELKYQKNIPKKDANISKNYRISYKLEMYSGK
jgi:hypothetical protein